jgi:hypothetical protein
MGSSKAPTVQKIDPADSVVAAVAKEPNSADNQAAHEQARARKRGITSTYARYAAQQQPNMKTKLGE